MTAKLTTTALRQERKPTANSTYKKLAVQCSANSFSDEKSGQVVLRNCQIL